MKNIVDTNGETVYINHDFTWTPTDVVKGSMQVSIHAYVCLPILSDQHLNGCLEV